MSAFDAFQRFFADPNNAKEQLMPATTTIFFTGGDYKPKKLASNLVGFRAPFDINIEPGKSLDIDLKTKCSCSLLFAKNVENVVVEPQENIVVRLTAGAEAIRFSAGDVIARGYPLLPPLYEIA